MRRDRFPCLAWRLGRIEPYLSYPSARPQPCRHSTREHNGSSIPTRKRGRKSRGMSGKRKRECESSDESQRETLNLACTHHIPVNSGPTSHLHSGRLLGTDHTQKLSPVDI
jgi:hypothetical protein